MRVNKVLLKKMEGAVTEEEVIEIANENGKKLSSDQAKAYLEALNNKREAEPIIKDITEREIEQPIEQPETEEAVENSENAESVEQTIDEFVNESDFSEDDEFEEITGNELRKLDRQIKIKRGIVIGGAAALAVTAIAFLFKKKK